MWCWSRSQTTTESNGTRFFLRFDDVALCVEYSVSEMKLCNNSSHQDTQSKFSVVGTGM